MPTVVGNHELLDRIGQGGMGEVWRARHRTLGRLVAVKLIRRDVGGVDDVLIRRFAREARTAASLRSPHTIQILDFGVSEDGTFFQVLELLDGLDLHALVERFGPLPPARAVALLRQACEALAEAHGQGFVHRDVKPSNLFVCRLGTRVEVLKVLDFGLARSAPGADARDSLVTQAGVVPGSPAFLAPEVIRALEPPGEKADVYALGCVAHWLLSGRLVFEGASPIELIVGHLERPAPPLAERAPGPLPEGLAALVDACLAKDPAARPGARELGRRLAALGLAWPEEEAERWWEQHLPAEALSPALPPGVATPLPLPPGAAHAPLPQLKEEAYTRLRRHFEESRIDVREYERRLGRARVADAPAGVLDALAGLPALPAPVAPPTAPSAPSAPTAPTALVPAPAPDLPAAAPRFTPLVTVLGSITRKGEWVVEPRLRVVTVLGNAELDLRSARLEPGCTELRVVSVFGHVEITVPPGLHVEVAGVGVAGSFDGARTAAGRPRDDTPWVRIGGAAVFGSVSVRVRALPTGQPGIAAAAAAGAEALGALVETVNDAMRRGREKERRRRRGDE